MRPLAVGILAAILGVLMVSATTTAQQPRLSSDDLTINPLRLQVALPETVVADAPLALTADVYNTAADRPAEGAQVQVALLTADRQVTLTALGGEADATGRFGAALDVPEADEGAYLLTVQAYSAPHYARAERQISLKKVSQVMLVTDKPLYQPSQIIHMRALALRKPRLTPVADVPLTLEVVDAKGNKVFKKARKTDAFGVAAADFQLADEINLGSYAIKAYLGEALATEKTVEVKRYVLPKFKVTLTLEKEWYLPGETVHGRVQADYFFGKPVARGDVKVTLSTFELGMKEIGVVQGRTDDTGAFAFEHRLPDAFVGLELKGGGALLQFTTEVADQAKHLETSYHEATVSQHAIVVQWVPESGRLMYGLPNRIYVLTTYPDGSPAQCWVTLRVQTVKDGKEAVLEQAVRSDEVGIAEVELAPEAVYRYRLPQITVRDDAGQTGEWSWPTEYREQERRYRADPNFWWRYWSMWDSSTPFLLRTDKALHSVGDTLRISAICRQERQTLYFEVLKEGQVMVSRVVEAEGGKATLEVPLDNSLSGSLQVWAYGIGPTGGRPGYYPYYYYYGRRFTGEREGQPEAVRDARSSYSGAGAIFRDGKLVYVRSADDLHIGISADKDTHLPGEDATIRFHVTDTGGHPTVAALGVAIVDEAVFALQEMQPGLEKVFFTLEKDLATPRYQIKGFGAAQLTERMGEDARRDAMRERAAEFLFAAVEPRPSAGARVDTYAQEVDIKRPKWAATMQPAADRLLEALERWEDWCEVWARQGIARIPLTESDGTRLLLWYGLLKQEDTVDLWGTPFRYGLQPSPLPENDSEQQMLEIQPLLLSAGPDRTFGTYDDTTVYAREWWRLFERKPGRGAGGGLVAAGPSGEVPGARPPAPPGQPAGEAAPRVREYFPETLLWEPALITDERGRAELRLTMADSITTWRLTAMGSSLQGLLGSTTAPLRVFQDFFVDIDLPVALTQGDEVSIPVAVYNYLPGKQKVRIAAERYDWFEPMGITERALEIGPNEVNVVYFPIRAVKNGEFRFQVTAIGEKMSDAIARQVRVEPNGQLVEVVTSDRFTKDVEQTVTIPPEAIEGASTILVKVYPGVFSQLVEGLDSLLRLPFGCFEQTSSITYPNVLVLQYLKATGKNRPEIQMKAEEYINLGYQRLLNFEVAGGGFEWWGRAPAHQVLTAYGLLEFTDMAKVFSVDPAIVPRAQKWLLSQQRSDGHWDSSDPRHTWTWSQHQGIMIPTAYCTWALAESGFRGPELERTVRYLSDHLDEAAEPYTLGLVANAFVAFDKDSPTTLAVLRALASKAVREGSVAYWPAGTATSTYSTGDAANTESTALAAYALLRAGFELELANQALTYLTRQKDGYGVMHNTQATILSLKALVASVAYRAAGVRGDVSVTIDGKAGGSFTVDEESSDVVQQVDLREWTHTGQNKVKLAVQGKVDAFYQVVTRYYVPWKAVPPKLEELLISVAYDRTQLHVNDTATATVTVVNKTGKPVSMAMVDVGIPPGFSVETSDLSDQVRSGVLMRYSVTGRQVTLYLESLQVDKATTITYRLRARFPIRAQTPRSRVYAYYNPELEAIASPQEVVVKE